MDLSDKKTIKIISNAIKEGRRKRGWSQKELATFMKVDPSLVSRWETGKGTPTGDKLFKLAVELDIVPLLFTDYFPPQSPVRSSEIDPSLKKEIEWLKQENIQIKQKLHKIEKRFSPI